jgi:hypothetical protein
MSIIQGRRMTMAQSKPGLVVVDLEEMPSNDLDANPNQLKVAQFQIDQSTLFGEKWGLSTRRQDSSA